jgi:hypothetical protein
MNKDILKVLIKDLERAVSELKSEVYSDTSSYRIDRESVTSYIDQQDDDGTPD